MTKFTFSRRCLAALTVAFTSVGCHSKTAPDGVATYTISGVVRSAADQSPLEMVIVQGVGKDSRGIETVHSAVTDAAGHYAIAGLRDSVTVTASRAGYASAGINLQLLQDAALDLTMVKGATIGSDLFVNKTVSGVIDAGDEKCDPDWDPDSPCRRFTFVPQTLRTYLFEVRCQGSGVELHVLNNQGTRVLRLFRSSSLPITADLPLSPAEVYEVRLMAYYSCRFDLTVK